MMSERKMKLKLDQEDVAAINEAIDRRLLLWVLPSGGGNLEGRAIAEICRGWLEMLGHNHKPALTPAEKDEAEGNAALAAFRTERGTSAAPSPKPFIAGQEYRTREGRRAKVYATDGGGKYPVQGAVLAGDGQWDQECWCNDGSYWDGDTHRKDLLPPT